MNREKKFREILKFAWSNSPFYQEIYSGAGIHEKDLDSIGLEDLPVISKSELITRFDEAVTDRKLKIEEIKNWHKDLVNPLDIYLDNYLIMNNSGSSRYESLVPYTIKNWRLFTTSAATDLIPEQLSLDRPIRSAFYFSSKKNTASGTNVILASRSAHDVLRFFQKDPIEEVCSRLNAFNPERLTSLPSSIGWLLQYTELGLLKIKPKSVVVSGETLPNHIRDAIRHTWNAEIFDLYAASESPFMAIKKPGKDFYQIYKDLNLIEVLDENHKMVETGERGRVYLTNLENRTLPFIRYDMSDYASIGEKNFGAETLLSLDGKTIDGLRIPTIEGGSHEIPIYELTNIKVPKLKQIQYILHSPKDIEIQYIASENIDREVEYYFKTLIGENFRALSSLEVNQVNYIANSKDTKFHYVVKNDEPKVQFTSFNEQSQTRKTIKISRREPNFLLQKIDTKISSINERFYQVASVFGEHDAIIGHFKKYTYTTLNQISNQIANELLLRGFDNSQPVCVLCGHQPDSIAMIFGILKAGGFFSYLDPNLPEVRNVKILGDIQPGMILTNEKYENYSNNINKIQTKVILINDGIHDYTDEFIPRQILPSDPACLLYTSGTTGASKGVILSHQTILSRAARASVDFQINPNDKISLIQSIGVNAGIRDIFTSLLNGAALSLYDIYENGINKLGNWINDQNITHLYFVPTILRMFAETNKERYFPSVDLVRLGGEIVSKDDMAELSRIFNHKCYFINGYASTETGTICHYIMDHATKFVAGRVPVGKSVKGISVRIVDEKKRKTTNTLGEIAVQGESLASGYWDPEQKKTVPFEDDYFPTGDLGYQIEDGNYFLLGRKDRTVKIHGYRINLDEIEGLIKRINGISDAAIVHNTTINGGVEVNIYYEVNRNVNITSDEIEKRLISVLPGRKLINHYYQLLKIPRSPGGKFNRYEFWNLPINPILSNLSNGLDSSNEEEILTETEKILAEIWRDILNCNVIRKEDEFFHLGGDSIAVFRFRSRVEKTFGVNISVSEFFKFDTVELMAKYIDTILSR